MWSLYGADKNSVCIFSTEDKLLSQIQSESINVITLKDVEYLNHGSDFFEKSNLAPFVAKALPFSFEKELRIVSYNPTTDLNASGKNNASGEKLKINSLSELIEKVVVSPKADAWFFNSIQKLCAAYGLNVEVKDSSLRANRIESFYDAFAQLQRPDL